MKKWFVLIAGMTAGVVFVRAAQDQRVVLIPSQPPFTSPAQYYSGISDPGEPVVGDGSGGWVSGRSGVRYKGPHPKPGWQLDWDDRGTATGSAIKEGLFPPVKPLMELHLRDTIIRLVNGTYYMTGSTGDNIWDRNDGVELWHSKDLKTWEYLGISWVGLEHRTGWHLAKGVAR
jgi:xylan 1,4-beta-xylosidase